MSKSKLEKRLASQRHQSDTVLVHKLNELLKSPVGIDSEDDADFLRWLAMKQVEREEERKKGDGVFSPSGLASCLRRSFLSKNWKKLGLERVELPAIEPHYYFVTGDFIHLKWQFILWKLSQVDPDFHLIDCEIPVMSKRGDHAGTIDVLCLNDGEFMPLDVKGLNVRSFAAVDMNETPMGYRIQLTDYMILFNAGVQRGKIKPSKETREVLGRDTYPKIHRGLILAENKGGPDAKHPAALAEHVIRLKDHRPEIRARLEILRAHEEENTFPEIECVSTRSSDFTGCPFAGICEREVSKREWEDASRSDTKQYRVARPGRGRRTR